MALCRVFYRADGTVAVAHPNPDIEGTELEKLDRQTAKINASVTRDGTFDELKGLPYDDIEISMLPAGRSSRGRWRRRSGGGIEIDYSFVTSTELRQVDLDALDAELAKPSPDPVTVIALDRKIKKNQY